MIRLGTTRLISIALRPRSILLFFAVVVAIVPVVNAQSGAANAKAPLSAKPAGNAPTVAEAERFISRAETRLLDLWIKNNRASWVAETFITDDTEAIAAEADAAVKAATSDLARQARRYENLSLSPDVARKFLSLIHI